MAAGWDLCTRGRAVALLLALALALLGSGCTPRGDPADAVKRFFSRVAAGDVAGAYADTTIGFQAQQTQIAFGHNIIELGLNAPVPLTVSAPQITANEAHVAAELTRADRPPQKFAVTLVYETGAWRVHALRSPRGPGERPENRFTLLGKGAAFSPAQSEPLPSEEEIRKLAHTVMADFDEAVQQRSFAGFYETLAVAWKKQLRVGQLDRAFGSFIEAGVHFGGLAQAELQLDGPPTINPAGILLVSGHFNTAPYQVYFAMKFMHEPPWWKLFGLDVHLQD